MNYLTIQYLEDSPDLPGLAVEAVRQRMQQAAARFMRTVKEGVDLFENCDFADAHHQIGIFIQNVL